MSSEDIFVGNDPGFHNMLVAKEVFGGMSGVQFIEIWAELRQLKALVEELENETNKLTDENEQFKKQYANLQKRVSELEKKK